MELCQVPVLTKKTRYDTAVQGVSFCYHYMYPVRTLALYHLDQLGLVITTRFKLNSNLTLLQVRSTVDSMQSVQYYLHEDC